MRNSSKKIDLTKTCGTGSVSVQIVRRFDNAVVKEIDSTDCRENFYTEVRMYNQLIFSSQDGLMISSAGWASNTIIRAINTILKELNLGDIKLRSYRGELSLIQSNNKKLAFFDGIDPTEIYKQKPLKGGEKNEK